MIVILYNFVGSLIFSVLEDRESLRVYAFTYGPQRAVALNMAGRREHCAFLESSPASPATPHFCFPFRRCHSVLAGVFEEDRLSPLVPSACRPQSVSNHADS